MRQLQRISMAMDVHIIFDEKNLQKLFKDVLKKAGISSGTNAEFPLIVRKGKNKEGKE